MKERRKKYRDYVTSKPELMQSLLELRGKALGCLCQSPHSCHGHVLVDLVMKAFSPEDYCMKASKGNIYYFKGSFSPLSNFYLAVVVDGPPQQRTLQKKFRLGSFQLYYWQKAVNTGVLKIANAICKVKSVKRVRLWSKKIPIVETPLPNQILSMHIIESSASNMCRLLQCDKLYNECCLQTEYPRKPHPTHSAVAGLTCGLSKGAPRKTCFPIG